MRTRLPSLRAFCTLLAFTLLAGFSGSGCTTTYTKADLQAEERKRDQHEREAERAAHNAEEVGGRNMEAMGEAMEEAVMEVER